LRVIGYVRVSTTKQADSGLSIEAQELKIRQYCDLYELDLIKVIVECESAKNLNRQGIQEAIDLLQLGKAEGLIITKLDRLTRSLKDLSYLLDYLFQKAFLFSVYEHIDTKSANGRLVLNILTSVSQWEREELAERTKEALMIKKAKGEYTGGKSPLGWRVNELGEEVPDEAEQELIAIVRGYRDNRLSYSEIAQKLTEAHFTSRTGNAKFSKSAAKRINDAETTEERAKRKGLNE
jgi:DNA invertase Pin-like site-specific DNA recombinase